MAELGIPFTREMRGDPVDCYDRYLRELMSNPELEKEDETQCAQAIQRGKSLRIVTVSKVDRATIVRLDLGKVFANLTTASQPDAVVKALIDYYHSSEESPETCVAIPYLYKYLRIYKTVGRPLNISELMDKFHDLNFELEIISEIELLQEIKAYLEYCTAYNKLFFGNMRLVKSVVSKCLKTDKVSEDDVFSIGCIALHRAISSYDPEKLIKFSTYATRVLTNDICMYISSSIVPVSGPYDAIKAARRVEPLLTDGNADVSAIAAKTGMKYDTVVGLGNILQEAPLSLSAPTCDGEGDPLIDFISDRGTEVIDKIASKDLAEDIKRLLEGLAEKESLVIRLRYGLIDGVSYSQEDIARMMGISRTRIGQIEQAAKNHILAKMKRDGSVDDFIAYLR